MTKDRNSMIGNYPQMKFPESLKITYVKWGLDTGHDGHYAASSVLEAIMSRKQCSTNLL